MRRLALILMLSSGALVACGDTTDTAPVETVDQVIDQRTATPDPVERTMTAADRMVGEWNQETAFQMSFGEYGFTIMNGEVDYEANGTGEIEAMLVVDGLPDGENTYEIDLDTTYSLTGDTLTETFTTAEVEPINDTDRTRTIAQAIEDALSGAGTTTSTVVSIDDSMLVRRVDALDTTLRYSRDID